MNSPSDSRAELLELCDQLLDGALSAEQRARLEQLVLGDAALRRLYVEYLHLHAGLRQSRPADAPLAEVLKLEPEESSRVVRFEFRRWQQAVMAVAAAMVLLIGGVWFGQRHSGEAQNVAAIATLAETKGARWESGRLPTEAGAALGPGRLRLADGLATIVFKSGAKLTLEAPAELELISTNRCFLHSGALVAHVPPPAVGFVVETANARLVDHGTDFGVTADANGQAQVQVFQGEVELQHHRSGENLRLTTRKSTGISPDAFTKRAGEETEATRSFARRVEPRNANVVTISSAAGRGQAAYVASLGTVTHHSDTLLLLKNSNTPGYRRKAYLRFDLATLAGRRATDASLTLVFEPTGFGFASFVGDAHFAVYGVTEDALDAWTEDKLDWETAPAASEDAGAADTTRAVKLGAFTLPEGTLSGACSIGGKALADFLNSDRNHLATLIVVRETSETGRGASVVHGFAGNNHPTLAPPTLRVTLAEKRLAKAR
jgi:hypothetical protein